MTRQQQADLLLSDWQGYRDQAGAIVANAMLHEMFMTPEERATDQAVREAISEPCGVESCCVPTSGTTTPQLQSRFSEAF